MANAESNKPKWTPGPWRVGPVDDTRVTGPDGSEIAAIDGDYNQPDLWPVMEANARLISAAPDMFAALKQLEAYAEVQVRRHPEATDTPLWQSVLSAISKASEPRS